MRRAVFTPNATEPIISRMPQCGAGRVIGIPDVDAGYANGYAEADEPETH